MSEPRSTCEECGEELWGPEERHGRCYGCQQVDDYGDDGSYDTDGADE